MSFEVCSEYIKHALDVGTKLAELIEEAYREGITIITPWLEIATRGYVLNNVRELLNKLRVELAMLKGLEEFKKIVVFKLPCLSDMRSKYDEFRSKIDELARRLATPGLSEEEIKRIRDELEKLHRELLALLNQINNMVALDIAYFKEYATGISPPKKSIDTVREIREAYERKDYRTVLDKTYRAFLDMLRTFEQYDEWRDLQEETAKNIYAVQSLAPRHFIATGLRVPVTIGDLARFREAIVEFITWIEKFINFLNRYLELRREFRRVVINLAMCLLHATLVEKFRYMP